MANHEKQVTLTSDELAQIAADTAARMFKQDVWYELDTADLTGVEAQAVAAYDDANNTMRLAREIMEEVLAEYLADRIPVGLEPRFAYRWGKKSVSPVVPTVKSAKSGGKIRL